MSLIEYLLPLTILVFVFYRFRAQQRRNAKLTSELQTLQQQLEQKNALFTHTLSTMDEGIIVVDSTYRIREINAAACSFLQCSPEIIGLPLHELPSNKLSSLQAIVQQTLQTHQRQIWKNISLVTSPTGEVRQLSGSVQPWPDEQQEASKAIIFLRDTTHAFQQEKFLHVSTINLQSYTWILNVQTQTFTFGESIIGTGLFPKQADTVSKCAQFVHLEDRDTFILFFTNIMKKHSGEFVFTFRMDPSGQGNYNWWETRTAVQTTPSVTGLPLKYIYGMNINVDHYKRSEAQLETTMKKTAKLNQAKSTFFTNISHEIRTRLNSIIGFADLLCTESPTEVERLSFNGEIKQNSTLLLALLNDMLDLSHLEAGLSVTQLTTCKLDSFLTSVREAHNNAMSPNVTLQIEPLPPNLTMRTDETKLIQVFAKLINNACRVTSAGSIKIGATLTTDGQWIEFFVSDTGKGIAKHHLPHLFERFYTIEKSNPSIGLGLPTCKTIMELLGGNIRLESTEGQGTTVYFQIPHGKSPIPQHDTAQTYIPDSTQEQSTLLQQDTQAKKHLLIAEDTDSNYMLLKALLKKDYDLSRARNGKEAVELFKTHTYDAILMDVRMPHMDGIEATAEIRKLSTTIPIIAQTAYAFATDREHCLAVGCTDFLSKPIKPDTLRNLIQKYV